jgi:transcriptional regulator
LCANFNFKYDKANIELRRGKVLELVSKGHSQVDIAKTLNVSPALISLDIQFLKERARENLRTHLQEKLPFEHSRAMTGINDILKKANAVLDNTEDPKLQLQTINVLANLYAGILTMASDGNIIQQAMEKVEPLEDIKRGRFENSEPITTTYENKDTDSDPIEEAEEESAEE